MTTLVEVFDLAVEQAKRVKAIRARKADHEIPTLLLAYRGRECAAQIWPERIDRDLMLKCARVAAVGFSADILVLVFEVFVGTGLTDPRTGKRWGSGAMADAASNDNGRERGWVSDAVAITAYNRAGDKAFQVYPYRIVNKNVVWKEVQEQPDQFGGYVDDVLSDFMASPTLDLEMRAMGIDISDYGLDIEEARAHQDCEVAKILLGQTDIPNAPRASVVLACEPNTARERIIRKSLPDGKIFKARAS